MGQPEGGAVQRLTWPWRILAAVVIALTRLLRWRVEVEGLEHVPRRGGAVLVFNHHSYLDFVAVAWPVVRELRRPVRFIAKREVWTSRWVGWAARAGQAVPVDRASSSARAGAFDAAVVALRQGDLVAVAPEQTIAESFELLPFRTGAVRMAQLAGVPLVPVLGWGTQRCAAKGSRPRLVTRLPVTVRFGPPTFVPPEADPVEVTRRLHERMWRLLHEVQERYPDGAPAGASWVPRRLGGAAPEHSEVLGRHRERAARWRDQARGDASTRPPSRHSET